ncbi:MAG: hypothetical protein HY551_00940 [Elusimicrobia bacterium]|nr:hypothetical protein [Elusimicrobiota bacterium]
MNIRRESGLGWVVCGCLLFGMSSRSISQDAQAKPGALPGMTSGASAGPRGGAESAPSAGEQPSAQAASGAVAAPAAGSNLPSEVVIKGSGAGGSIRDIKPPLRLDMDPFESIRASLVPDESLLLAESPFTVSWRRTYPEFLNNRRVIEPWHTTFADRPGIIFQVRAQLFEAMLRALDPKEVRGFGWKVTIADAEGRVFQSYDGLTDPPGELVWSGQNDQEEWIQPGRSYSAVYTFTDPSGSPHTRVGKPIQMSGIVHQESNGLHVSLDSGVLFGPNKSDETFSKPGEALLRSAADLIKRRFTGIPIRVQILASTRELAEAQAGAVQNTLIKELMLLAQNITNEGAQAPFSEQRVEIILLNR